MTLTEQWKKGELESGYYFFKTKDNIKFGFLYEGFKYPYDGRYNTIDNVQEVLAPVPSYDEWQAKKEENKNLYKMLDVLNGHLDSLLKEDKENQQLKELLKECREELKPFIDFFTKKPTFASLITKIDNAIGEKK